LYCPVSSDESQIKEVSIDLFEHFDFSPEKLKTLQGNDKTLPYLINYLEFNEIPLTGAHPGFVVKGGVSMRGVWGLERVPDRTFIGNGSSGGLRNYRHLFERQFGSNHTIFIRQKKN
jgi:hypothetical protein